jgi:hypothetical protein
MIDDAQCMGLQRFHQLLLAFKPGTMRGCRLKLVAARHKTITCPVVGCMAKFGEQKECNRYIQKSHANMTESQVVPSAKIQTAC